MPHITKPEYDYKSGIFQEDRRLIRYAEDHLKMIDLANYSDTIRWEAHKTVSPLKIPIVYHVHFQLRSITGINDDQSPIYHNEHTLELSITTRYPMEPCSAFMLTDIWHPNVKSKGKFKGRVCVNSKGLGMAYSLDQVVLRIGEILQYKNYLAEFVPPYPEDEGAAEWVREFAEPNNIVHKEKSIFTDDVPLLREHGGEEDAGLTQEDAPITPEPKIKIKIKGLKKPASEQAPKSKIVIRRDNNNQ